MVSSDNSLLFISAVIDDSDEMYCVDASSGRLQWAHNSDDDGYVARPVYRSRDGDSRNGVLYTVSVSLIGMCAIFFAKSLVCRFSHMASTLIIRFPPAPFNSWILAEVGQIGLSHVKISWVRDVRILLKLSSGM